MFEESIESPWRNHANPLSSSIPNTSFNFFQTQTFSTSLLSKTSDIGSYHDPARVFTEPKGKCESSEWQVKIDRTRDLINGAQVTLKQRQERLRELEAMAYQDDSALTKALDNHDKYTPKVHDPVPVFTQLSQISIQEYQSRFYPTNEYQYKGKLKFHSAERVFG